MKCLYFLLLVTVSQAHVPRVRREADIPVPTLTSLTTFDPHNFIVQWRPIKADAAHSADPVIGYKVKLWEQAKIKQYHYEIIDGVKQLVEEDVPVELPNTDTIPDGIPEEVVVNGADKSTALFGNIKMGVQYEIRVQAFTKTRDGPLSQPIRITILPEQKDLKHNMYQVV